MADKQKPPKSSPIIISNGANSATVSTGNFSLQYPLDLTSSDEYGKNMVAFFIQVAAGSSIAKNSKADGSDARSVISGYAVNSNVPGQRASPTDQLAKGSQNGSLISGAAELLGANEYRNLSAAICLYMPGGISNTYSVNWAAEDIGGMVGAGITAATNAAGENGFLDTIKATLGTASSVAKSFALGNEYSSYIEGKTPGNSKEQQLFKSVGFRTFSFAYSFSPRSTKEADAVLNIIRMFRYHMLPEYADDAKMIFVYPSRFQVVYFIDGKENAHIEKQMTAVLTSMAVTYSDGSQFTTFQDGMPTKINMTLNFTEIALPTKETSPYDKQGV